LPDRYTTKTIEDASAYVMPLGSEGECGKVDLLPGDACNKAGSHIILFDYYSASGGLQSMEQTPNTATRRYWSWSSLQDFRPLRRKQIVKSAPGPAIRADVNGDGHADLVSLHSSGGACFWQGMSDGLLGGAVCSLDETLDPALFDPIGQASGHYVVDVADVDGNGNADLVTIDTNGQAYVYQGGTTGFCCGVASLSGTMILADATGQGYDPIAAADVNGDGRADLVAAHTNGSVYVFQGTTDRGFGSASASFAGTFDSAVHDGEGHYPVDVADVTGDGCADLVTIHRNGHAYVFPGRTNGLFAEAVASFAGTMQLALLSGNGHEPVGAGDVNGDGRADLVTVFDNGNVYVFPGTSSGAFVPGIASFAGSMRSSLFGDEGHEIIGVLDITGDGKTDLLTSHSRGSAYVFPGTAFGGFASSRVSFVGGLDSSRFDGVGHEFASEHIWARRRGCDLTGC
jgi:hypothetical protein